MIKSLKSSAPGVLRVETALQGLNVANGEVRGARLRDLPILKFFTKTVSAEGKISPQQALGDANKMLNEAFLSFLQKQDGLGPDQDQILRERVSAAVQKAAPQVFDAVCKFYTLSELDRMGH